MLTAVDCKTHLIKMSETVGGCDVAKQKLSRKRNTLEDAITGGFLGGPLMRRSEARIQLSQYKVVSAFINSVSFKVFPNTPSSGLASLIR